MFFKLFTTCMFLASVATFAPVKGAPLYARHEGHSDASSTSTSTATKTATDSFVKQNGLEAQALNAKWADIKPTDACKVGEMACINGGFAQCVANAWVVQACSADLRCYALPLVNKPGTSLACTTRQDTLDRIKASGVSGGIDGEDDDEEMDCPEEDEDAKAIDEEDDDIPYCDELEDEFDVITSSTAPKASATAASQKQNYRRQATPAASTITVFPPFLTTSAVPTDITTVPALPASSSLPVATPTVVAGSNGVVTVTVVSTVTVSATDCGATQTSSTPATVPAITVPAVTVTASPTSSTPVTVPAIPSSSIPQTSVVNTIVSSALPRSTLPAGSSSATPSSSTVAGSTITNAPKPIILKTVETLTNTVLRDGVPTAVTLTRGPNGVFTE